MARSSDENWKLTPYEFQRKPQEIFVGDVESAVTPKSLHKELMCPICLAILKKTMTTKECLHRFCADCIITALRSGNKECPTCRKKLISKRSLRPDKNFDLLISEIYPNLDQYEAEHEQSIARLNLSYMQTLTGDVNSNDANISHKSKKITQPNKSDNEKRMRKRRKYLSISQQLSHLNQDNKCEPDLSLPSNSNNNATNKPSVSREVELTFKPHPESELMRDDKSRYIKTTAGATVDHLKKYLTMRLNLDRDLNPSIESDDAIHLTANNVSIYIAQSSDHLITLNGSETLEQLADNFERRCKQLVKFCTLKSNNKVFQNFIKQWINSTIT